jgi:predicted transcriptional regulator
MDVKEKKLDLIEWLLHLKDEATIEKMYQLKESTDGDWYHELPEAAKKSIQQGLKEAREGIVTPHDQVMERMRAKYNIKK